MYLFVLRAFYAHGEPRTPFVINVFENIINIVLAFVLVGRFGVLGLGLAFAIAYVIVGGVWAMQVLGYKVPGFPVRADRGDALAGWRSPRWSMAEAVWLVGRRSAATDGHALAGRAGRRGRHVVGRGRVRGVLLRCSAARVELTRLQATA